MTLRGSWRASRRLVAPMLGFGLFLAAPGYAQQRNIHFTRISIEQGLSQSAVNAIFQDRRGFMWFGTEDGLNRFDGYRFTVYKHDREKAGSLSNNFVRVIFEDREGTLWIGTDGGGLNRWNRDDETFRSFKNDPADPTSLSSNLVHAIYEDSRGELWVGTDTGLNRLDRVRGSFNRFHHNPSSPGSLSNDHVRVVCEDRQGTLWVGTYGGGLNRLDRGTGTFQHFRHDLSRPSSLGDDRVLALYEGEDGVLWVGHHGGGVSRLDRGAGAFTHLRHDAKDPAGLSDDRVRAIIGGSDRRIWVATEKGLNRWDPKARSFLRYKHDPLDAASLSDDRILSLYKDRGGVLWVGTRVGGLNKWNVATDAFAHWKQDPSAPSSLSSNVVTSFSEDRDGRLWIGTFGGGLNRIDRATGGFQHYRDVPSDPTSLSDDYVMSLLVDARGTLWVGTRDGGVNRFDRASGKFAHFRHDPRNAASLSANGVTTLLEDRSGVLWVGTYGGGLNRFDRAAGSFTRYRHADSPGTLSNDRVTALFESRDGILWIGTEGGGLNRFHPHSGTFAQYRNSPAEPRSLSSDEIMSIHEDRSGVLWIGTRGAGLNRWERGDREAHRGVFTVYTERDGLPNAWIYGILEDARGLLWLSTNRGLSRLDPRTQTFKSYDTTDGLQSNEFNFGAHYRSSGGEMFFGGINGFNAFDPEKVRDNPHPPPVVLTGFLKSDQPARLHRAIWDVDELALGYRDYVVSFEFAALDYAAPGRNRYEYKLEGFDERWIDPGTVRRVTYTNLDAGNYVLRIRAANGDGAWNKDGVSLKLRVVPPPWRSWWAYVLYFLLLAGLIGLYVRGQRRKLAREEENSRKLEGVVRARTEELAQRNQDLEVLNLKLEEASLTDSLTGLRNRRFVVNYIDHEVSLVLRGYLRDGEGGVETARGHLAFLMIDLDGFKSINDVYGHNAGDALLVEVTEVLKRACRTSETLVRWGGDEFLVVGQVTDPRSAQLLAERIRRMIEQNPLPVREDAAVRITCSVGFACIPFLPSSPRLLSWEQVLALADRALYVAKNSRRNAWVGIFSNESTREESLLHTLWESPESLFEDGSLDVVTSLPAQWTLQWGEGVRPRERAHAS